MYICLYLPLSLYMYMYVYVYTRYTRNIISGVLCCSRSRYDNYIYKCNMYMCIYAKYLYMYT